MCFPGLSQKSIFPLVVSFIVSHGFERTFTVGIWNLGLVLSPEKPAGHWYHLRRHLSLPSLKACPWIYIKTVFKTSSNFASKTKELILLSIIASRGIWMGERRASSWQKLGHFSSHQREQFVREACPEVISWNDISQKNYVLKYFQKSGWPDHACYEIGVADWRLWLLGYLRHVGRSCRQISEVFGVSVSRAFRWYWHGNNTKAIMPEKGLFPWGRYTRKFNCLFNPRKWSYPTEFLFQGGIRESLVPSSRKNVPFYLFTLKSQ